MTTDLSKDHTTYILLKINYQLPLCWSRWVEDNLQYCNQRLTFDNETAVIGDRELDSKVQIITRRAVVVVYMPDHISVTMKNCHPQRRCGVATFVTDNGKTVLILLIKKHSIGVLQLHAHVFSCMDAIRSHHPFLSDPFYFFLCR